MHNLVHQLATAALIASASSVSALPLHVDVSQLMDDKVALHGMTIATASSGMKIGKWSVLVSQSFLQDNVLSLSPDGQRLLLPDLYQKTRRGFRDMTISAGRSYKVRRRLQFDLTMGSTVPTGGTFGTAKLDESADAMLSTNRGPTTVWAGVTQHVRRGGGPLTRKYLTEYYAGMSHSLGALTSVRAIYYHGQSDRLESPAVTSMSVSLNHDLRDLGNVGLRASQTKDWTGNDKRASVSLQVDKLPF